MTPDEMELKAQVHQLQAQVHTLQVALAKLMPALVTSDWSAGQNLLQELKTADEYNRHTFDDLLFQIEERHGN